MDIQFYGANCISLTTKGARVVIDDNLASLGGKSVLKPGDIALFTSQLTEDAAGLAARGIATKVTIDHAGEYEVSDISIYGIPARAHMDEPGEGGQPGKQTATMYKLLSKELSVLITGHIYPELTDEQLETIGMVDVMCVPVGGNGYTLDPVGALKIIKQIEPKIIIPTHYDGGPGSGKAPKYDVPQQPLEQAITALSMEPQEAVQKLKLKNGELPDAAQLVVLEQS
jgi:L-ascorbate metabolism protein UlaG (beta-lactamase superfamily)